MNLPGASGVTIPRGSLLVWVDSFLAQPNTRMERKAGRIVNLMLADHLSQGVLDRAGHPIRDRIKIKSFDFHDDGNTPIKHGQFSDLEFWKPSFWAWEN